MSEEDLTPYYLQSTRLSDISSVLAQGEQPLDKDRSIIAQSAGKDAAEITKALIGANIVDISDAFQVYSDLKRDIFNDTLALAGAESVVQAFEGAPQSAPQNPYGGGQPQRAGGGGGGGNSGPASLVSS